nr:cytochrome P450 CYP749A22-like [Ipomoea batatas]
MPTKHFSFTSPSFLPLCEVLLGCAAPEEEFPPRGLASLGSGDGSSRFWLLASHCLNVLVLAGPSGGSKRRERREMMMRKAFLARGVPDLRERGESGSVLGRCCFYCLGLCKGAFKNHQLFNPKINILGVQSSQTSTDLQGSSLTPLEDSLNGMFTGMVKSGEMIVEIWMKYDGKDVEVFQYFTLPMHLS